MRLASVVPGLATLARYDRRWLRGDLLAGITVAAYLVPQVLAYASLAGLPPVVGLWTCLPSLLAYALFGTSRLLSAGPESTTAIMTVAVVGPLAAGDPRQYAALTGTLALAVGGLALAGRLLRLGVVADLLSRPVLIGYLAGVAVIMVVSQLGKLTGVDVEGDGMVGESVSFLTRLASVHWPTAVFATAVLVFLFAVQRWLPSVPGPLLSVLLATAAVAVFDLTAHGIRVIGAVPAGVPSPTLPDLARLPELALPAIGILLVGYTDTILTARGFAHRGEGEEIDADQEFVALGVANAGASLCHGMPVSSSGSRTALADASGGRSQLYSLVALVVVLAVLLFFGPLLALFPSAALGAIVVYAAVRLVDVAGFRRLARFRRSELLLALGTLTGVLLVDILYGVLIAVALSVAELLYRVARPHDAIQGLVPGLAGMHDVDDYPEATTIPGLVVYRYDSPLFFANAENFRSRALAAADDHDGPVAWFVLNMEANVEVDITALDAVDQLRADLRARGIVLVFARVKQDLRDDLEAFGLLAEIGPDHVFPTLPTAVEAYHKWRGEPGSR